MRAVCCAVLLSLGWMSSVYAAEVSVRYEKKIYYLKAEFEVKASPARVMQVLTDYEGLVELGPTIIASDILNVVDENTTKVRTTIKDCILFFCKKVSRVENIVQHGDEKLEMFVIPDQSDVRSGYSVWTFSENASGTSMTFDANFQSKFWIPPIIRSQVLTRKFKRRVEEGIKRLQEKVDGL